MNIEKLKSRLFQVQSEIDFLESLDTDFYDYDDIDNLNCLKDEESELLLKLNYFIL